MQTTKAYDGHRLSYARSYNSPVRRFVIGLIEVLTGRRHIQRVYDELHEEDPDPFKVWGNALTKLNIRMDYEEGQLSKIPKTGPLIVVANHPFGVVDGAMLCHIVTRVRRDFFLLVNEVLSHEPIMMGRLLPVDFRPGQAAKATNLQTKAMTTQRLQQGEALVIFPAGAVATATRFFGPVEEFPWRRFICTRIHETQCNVLPIYFHGTNSRLFQFVSKISMDLRLGLLLSEIMNKRGKTIRAEIGAPVLYTEMAPLTDRQELIEFLRQRTMSLGEAASQQPGKKSYFRGLKRSFE